MSNLKWLLTESESWVEEGIITSTQQARLLDRYKSDAANQRSPLVVLFSVIGALLVGLGIIMVFATNWWRIPVPIKLAIAFLPLLFAQGICIYTLRNRIDSLAFREGSATFLVASFFAVVALVGQVFHVPSDFSSFILLCGIFALPVAYLFRSKAAMTIYVLCALFGSQEWIRAWIQSVLLTAASMPFFYTELRKNSQRNLHGYLMLLSSVLVFRMVFQTVSALGLAENIFVSYVSRYLSTALALLIIDEVYHKTATIRIFSTAKLLGCIIIAVAIFASLIDIGYYGKPDYSGYMITVMPVLLFFICYACLRGSGLRSPVSSDLFAFSAALLLIPGSYAYIMANILVLALGLVFIVLGSKTFRGSYINLGMAFLVLLIGIRFFDSEYSLLTKGIVFILLGIAFFAVNIGISRKWKVA